ncbi:DNA repair protein RecO [Enterococcus timonensis]|uniref:DNA repair protein RecO n=1 Tax=Enterococcus timonensis TaxID=1852364 RepID=UPI0008DAF58D|nr:DNA repair protein RecO [Enterococcus timonensis]
MFGESRGLIIYSRDHKEKDKLVKIFTEKYGKMVFFVKGAHRKNNPLSAAIMPMTEALYSGDFKTDGLSFLNVAKEIEPFYFLQQDIFANAYATYLLNLADAAIVDRESDQLLYTFLETCLKALNAKKDPEVVTNIFELQILPRFGISLELSGCAVCGNTKGPFDFSEKFHGLLCAKHFDQDPRRLHADPKACYLLKIFSQLPITRLGKINVSETTKKNLRTVIDEIYDQYVGIHLKSKHFIDEMKKWEKMMAPKIDKKNETD